MRLLAVAFVVAVSAAACGGGEPELTTVPSNVGRDFGTAVDRLLAAGLRIRVDEFPPQAPGIGLGGYAVAVQSPRAPARVPRGSVVSVRLESSAFPSPVFPVDHPPTVRVPDLRGLRYSAATHRIPEGLWLALDAVPPLPPEASGRGLDAFVVDAQDPPPGTEMPYGCAPRGRGCFVSVVRLRLEVAP
jgi:beta-lactam-binding protein with PASTA domain